MSASSAPLPAIGLRCQGSAAVGLGHVMRAMSLAQAARRRGAITRFLMQPDGMANAIPAAQGFPVETVPPELAPEAEATWLAERLRPGAWIIVDGYGLGGLVSPLRARGLGVCAIDDAPGGTPGMSAADLFVNPSLVARGPSGAPEAAAAPNGGAGRTRVLLGPRYAPLRAAFRRARLVGTRTPREGARPVRLLILSGGSDVAGLTERALTVLGRAAAELPALQVCVVLGPAAGLPSRSLLSPAPGKITVEVVRAPRDLAALMADADLAITAAGTSVLELLCVGVPPLMVTVVSNQASAAAAVAAAGAGIDLGTPQDLAASSLAAALAGALSHHAALVTAGQGLVDGGGARRVLAALLSSAASARRKVSA